jgi:hypothetical protein
MHIGFCRRNLRERNHLEISDVDGRIILKLIFRKFKLDGGKDWIDMAEDRDRWWALVTQ